MICHPIFPVAIGQAEFDKSAEFKEIFFNSVETHMSIEGYSSETTGHVDIHHDESYKMMYAFVIQEIKKYVTELGVNANDFDYNVVKSWLNITKDRDNPVHNHCDAHVSFAYYVNIPTGTHRDIVFVNTEFHLNNLNNGMFPFNVTNWNYYNAGTWSYAPAEGSLFVFPAGLKHHVSKTSAVDIKTTWEDPTKTLDELKQMRICIAGDILMTFKEPLPVNLGLQPIKNWRVFE